MTASQPPPMEPSTASDSHVVTGPSTETSNASGPDGEATSSLPIPAGPLRSDLNLPRGSAERPSLWKRIRMRSRAGEPGAVGGVEARLDGIEKDVAQLGETLRVKLEALNERLEEVWESEEQLSHLADIQDKLDRLSESHAQLVASNASLRRTVIGLSVLVILAAVSAALLYSALL